MKIEAKTRRITVVDTTLRNAEQTPGFSLTQEEKIRLAERLSAAGVDELEAGIPVQSRSEQRFLKRLIARGLTSRINGWCRLRFEDIEEANRCGLQHINISIPLSTADLEASRMTRDQMLERLRSLVREWRGSFETITLELLNPFQADFRLLKTIKKMAPLLKISRIRISDSLGQALPEEVASLVEYFADLPGTEIEFYGVNANGMAAANSFAAVEAGAGNISLTVFGLGERKGSRNLAELTGILLQKDKYTLGIRLDELYALGGYVKSLAAEKSAAVETFREVPEELSAGNPLSPQPVLSPLSRSLEGQTEFRRSRISYISLDRRLEEERSRKIAGYLKNLSGRPSGGLCDSEGLSPSRRAAV